MLGYLTPTYRTKRYKRDKPARVVFLISLGMYLGVYALICWASYAMCRWLEGELFYMWGGGALFFWALGIVYLTYIATANVSPQAMLNPLASPGWLLAMLLVMLLPFWGGSWLHRHFSGAKTNFWEGLSFYAVYLLLVWSFNALVLVATPIFRLPFPVSISSLMPPGIAGNLMFSLFWLFPLGAPLIWFLLIRLQQGLSSFSR